MTQNLFAVMFEAFIIEQLYVRNACLSIVEIYNCYLTVKVACLK